MVPAVGGSRHGECRTTYDACHDFAGRLMAGAPTRVVVVSPHSPRQPEAFGVWRGERLRGDLGRFGAPDAGVDLPTDPEFHAALEGAAVDIDLWDIPASSPLDHGASIPLWFLAEAGWTGPTSILSLPWTFTVDRLVACGRALRRALGAVGGAAALVASGDMSHRVLPGAPAGHHPRAIDFDRELTDLVRAGSLDRIASIDGDLRELAAEDAADTSIIAAAALDYDAQGAEVLSYEHPFGVGYLVAIFHDRHGSDP